MVLEKNTKITVNLYSEHIIWSLVVIINNWTFHHCPRLSLLPSIWIFTHSLNDQSSPIITSPSDHCWSGDGWRSAMGVPLWDFNRVLHSRYWAKEWRCYRLALGQFNSVCEGLSEVFWQRNVHVECRSKINNLQDVSHCSEHLKL